MQGAPVDFIPLSGASLNALEGSAKRRDLDRAFALIDSNKRCRYFLAEDSVEYEMWLRTINDAIDNCKNLDPDIDGESESNDRDDDHEADRDITPGEENFVVEDQEMLGTELEIPIIEDIQNIESAESNEMKDGLAFKEDLSESATSRKGKIRERMSRTRSKMRSAVKGAKIDRSAFRQLNNDIFQKASRMRSEEKPSAKGSNNRITKVKSLKLKNEQPQMKEEIMKKDIILRTMKGLWNVKVDSKYIPLEKAADADYDENEPQLKSTDFVFEINLNHISWQNGEETSTENVFQKDLFQILEFHSQISESIVRTNASVKTKENIKQILTSGRVLREILIHFDDVEFNIHFLEYTSESFNKKNLIRISFHLLILFFRQGYWVIF